MTAHKRPEPLLDKAKLVAAVGGLVSLAVTLGLIPATVGDQISHLFELLLAAGGLIATAVPPLVHAFLSRGQVTPTADPRNDAGQKLVPKGSAATLPEAAVVLAAAERIFPATPAPTPPESPAA